MTTPAFGLSTPARLTIGRGNAHRSICNRRTRGARNARVVRASAGPAEMLASGDFLERIRAINRLGELGSQSARLAAILPVAAEDPNPQVRYAAVSHLAGFDGALLSDKEKQDVLGVVRFILVNDAESSCQSGAADVIAGLRLADGFDDLVDAFQRTQDWMLKFSIAAGLGELGDPRAFDFLTAILESDADTDTLLISAALGALGELGDARAMPTIEKFIESEDSSVRERASIARSLLVASDA